MAELTPRERFGLLLIDELPDRVITYPLVTVHATQILGCTVAEYATDGVILGKSQVAAWKLYKHDAISIFTGVGLIAEALGSKFQIRRDDIPILIEPVIKTEADYDKLKVPDLYRDGRLRVYTDAVDYCFETVGDILPVIVYIPAPFTTAAQLRGISNFLKDTIRAPEKAHRLLEISYDSALLLINACMEKGAFPMLVDPLASCSVISPRIFEDFALPYLKKLIHFMHRYDLDTMLHICGETELILKKIPDTNTDLFSLDKTDCVKAKNEIGDRIRIIGNITPSDLLYSTPEQVSIMVQDTLLKMKDTPKGFVMATGCEVPVKAPIENIKAFIKTSHEYGNYW
ncbi:uroporphyrinogen decarboxylase family protein [candidate division KSB1 bacterium]